MVELVHEIDKALFNPVWDQVRRPAPWDEVTWEQKADAAIAEEAAIPVTTIGDRVCQCATVNRKTIEDAIRTHNLTRVAEVTDYLGAAGGCGSCGDEVAAILAEMRGA
jgi:nitrogenase molybdenum-cofactor synthesis protein NifE